MTNYSWLKQLRTYNNYELIAMHCDNIAAYRAAMLMLDKPHLYNLAQEVAMVEEASWRCGEHCDDFNIDEEDVMWFNLLIKLSKLAGTGDLPETGDDWFDILQECERDHRKTLGFPKKEEAQDV